MYAGALLSGAEIYMHSCDSYKLLDCLLVFRMPRCMCIIFKLWNDFSRGAFVV